MFTKEDILARLQNGETADSIANEMATALNEATAEKKVLDEENAAKEKEEARVLNAKRAAVDDMLDAFCDYFVAAGEEDIIDEIKEIKTDKVIKMLDSTIEMAKSLEKLTTLEFPLFSNIPTVEKKEECGGSSCKCVNEPKETTFASHNVNWNPDAIIKNFLRNI